MKDENTYIFCFENEDEADNCANVIEMRWPKSNPYCRKLEIEFKKTKKEWYITIVKLGFTIGWQTLSDRIGPKIIADLVYLQKQNLHVSFENIDDVWEKIKGNIRLCLINSIDSINIENEIKREQIYKRKLTGENDEPAVKKSRW